MEMELCNIGDGYKAMLETVVRSPVLYYSAKASHAQLPDMPLQSDTQALRLIANIPLIQWGKKCHSREEKSAFT